MIYKGELRLQLPRVFLSLADIAWEKERVREKKRKRTWDRYEFTLNVARRYGVLQTLHAHDRTNDVSTSRLVFSFLAISFARCVINRR